MTRTVRLRTLALPSLPFLRNTRHRRTSLQMSLRTFPPPPSIHLLAAVSPVRTLLFTIFLLAHGEKSRLASVPQLLPRHDSLETKTHDRCRTETLSPSYFPIQRSAPLPVALSRIISRIYHVRHFLCRALPAFTWPDLTARSDRQPFASTSLHPLKPEPCEIKFAERIIYI